MILFANWIKAKTTFSLYYGWSLRRLSTPSSPHSILHLRLEAVNSISDVRLYPLCDVDRFQHTSPPSTFDSTPRLFYSTLHGSVILCSIDFTTNRCPTCYRPGFKNNSDQSTYRSHEQYMTHDSSLINAQELRSSIPSRIDLPLRRDLNPRAFCSSISSIDTVDFFTLLQSIPNDWIHPAFSIPLILSYDVDDQSSMTRYVSKRSDFHH